MGFLLNRAKLVCQNRKDAKLVHISKGKIQFSTIIRINRKMREKKSV